MSNKTSCALAVWLLSSSLAFAVSTVSVNPTSIATDETGTVQIDVTGLMGTAVTLRLYVDANGNGSIDSPADYPVWHDVVGDNVADWSPDMFSDTNGTLGLVTVDVRLFGPIEFPYTAGNYIWEAEDTQNATRDTTTFSVTQAAQVQSVSGTVRDGSTMLGIPGAFAALLPLCDGADEADRFYSAFADDSGAFTIQVPADVACRNRVVVGAKPGYLTPFAQLPNVFLDGTSVLTNQDPEISAGSWTVTGSVQYSSGPASGSGIPGTFLTAELADGPPLLAVGFTDENGDYSFELIDGTWNVEAPEDGISTRGAVYLEDSTSVVVSGANTSFSTLTLPAANAFFEGTVRDDGGLAVGGRWVGAFRSDMCDPFCYRSSAVSRADGSYTLGVIGPAGPSTYEYQLQVEDPLTGLVGERIGCEVISDGNTLAGRDLDHFAPTSFITGTLTDVDGQAVSGQCLFGQASSGCTGYTTAAVSECDGTYSMPVIDAQWNIDLRIDEFVSLYSGLAPDSIQRMETVAGMSIPDVDFILGPWRENPHITRLAPDQVVAGSHLLVLGYGFSFGSAPQIFFDATPATILEYRADQGGAIVEVPVSLTAGSYQITVTNTDSGVTSDPACIELGAGPYTPVCTISGNVTDSGGSVMDALVFVDLNGKFVRAAVTDASGNYSIGLDAMGSYDVEFRPPFGTAYPDANYTVTCGTTQDHMFATGWQLTGQAVDNSFNGISQLPVFAIEIGGAGYSAFTYTDDSGAFTLNVPGGFISGRTGHAADSRFTPTVFLQNTVSSDMNFGQIQATPGSLMTGTIVDESGSGVAANLALFLRLNGALSSVTNSDSCSGNFSVGLPPNLGTDEYRMDLRDIAGKGLQSSQVRWITPNGDQRADFDFTMFGESVSPPAPTAPRIAFVEPGPRGQVGQPLRFQSANLGGAAVDVLFSDGIGGFVAGTGTAVDAARAFVVTRVPAGAATGEVKIRVDGVDSAPVHFELLPGMFSAGAFTVSGTVTGGGAGTGVAVVWTDPAAACDDEGTVFVDYGVTDSGGNYGPLSQPGGDLELLFFPATPTTLTTASESRTGVASSIPVDTTLTAGVAVSVRAVDESMNPLENVAFATENDATGASDQRLTDSNGDVTLYVQTGDLFFGLFPLLGERLVETETQETIAGATDLGDRMLERGTIVGSAVQQADGSPVAGVLIEAQRNEDPYDFFHEVLADANGLFHGPVPADTMVQIRGTVFDDALSDFRIDAESDPTDDVIVYPATVVGPAGFVSGLVRDAGTTSPLGDITVLGFEEDPMNPGMLGNFIEQTFTCPDGTYDLKLPAGPHFIQFSDFENGVYAPEFYADAYCPSGASTVTVPDGGSVTANADLGPGGTISGTVTAGGFLHAGAIVCADSVLLGNCTVACTTSDMNGDYTLPVPPATDYVVSAFSPSLGSIECYNGDDGCVGTPTLVTVTAGMDTPNIDFDLSCSSFDFDGDGVSACAGDCNDFDANNFPGNTEVCDNFDNDCDTLIDEADPDVVLTTWYLDGDSDTYGDPGVSQATCTQPPGYVPDNTDCDDTDANVNPGQVEICGDGTDNDCDGNVDDDGVGSSTWYLDADSDTYGDPGISQSACSQPAGYVLDNTDCDDTDGNVNPGAAEVCGDAIDNDCDGNTDDDGIGSSIWYLDADSDTYGDIGVSQSACSQPAGYVLDNTDCDDTDANVNPGVAEVCFDAIDNDCDGNTDDDGVGSSTWYQDADSDTFGDPATSQSRCNQPGGFVSDNTDCDDTNGNTYPGAPEVNDGDDNQCSGDSGFGLTDEIEGVSGFFNVADKNEFSWQPQGGATMYEVARATRRDFSDTATKFATAGTLWSDSALPAPNETFHYLVRSLAPFVGDWGRTSSGDMRTVNVLVNGGMEDWTSPIDLAGWFEITGGGPVEQETNPTEVDERLSAARLTRTGAGGLNLQKHQISLQPGVDHVLSLRVKFDQVFSVPLILRLFNFTTGEDLQGDGTWAVGAYSFFFDVSSGYQTVMIPFTTDAGFSAGDDIRLVIGHRGATPLGSALWIDDVRIEE